MLQTAPYNFEVLIGVCWIGVFLIIGAFCRNSIPLCRKYLIPGCMLGGFVGLLVTNFGLLKITGPLNPSYQTMQFIVFHMFNISFICMGLMGIPAKNAGKIIKGSFFNSFLASGITSAQTVFGIVAIVAYNFFFDTNLLESAGILLSQGFAAGPGSALSYGRIYENAGFANMISLGLSFAAIGYLMSLLVGVPIANIIRRKRGLCGQGVECSEAEAKGIYDISDQPSAGKLRFMNNNIDTMSFQVGLVIVAYLFAITLMAFLETVLSSNVIAMIWGLFAFLVCMPCGLIIREIFIKRVFKCDDLFDDSSNSRILNLMVDFIAVGSLIGINIAVVKEWLGAMVIMSIGAALLTAVILWWVTRKMTEEYFPAEHMLGLYGNLTGTITTGFVLMRMVDPDFKSTVPQEMSLQGIVSMIIGLPLMPITMPIMYGQVLYGKGYVSIILLSLIMGSIYILITKLPFWHNQDKIAKF